MIRIRRRNIAEPKSAVICIHACYAKRIQPHNLNVSGHCRRIRFSYPHKQFYAVSVILYVASVISDVVCFIWCNHTPIFYKRSIINVRMNKKQSLICAVMGVIIMIVFFQGPVHISHVIDTIVNSAVIRNLQLFISHVYSTQSRVRSSI